MPDDRYIRELRKESRNNMAKYERGEESRIPVVVVDDILMCHQVLANIIRPSEKIMVVDGFLGIEGIDTAYIKMILQKHLLPIFIIDDVMIKNGFNLVKTLKKIYPKVKFIIMSGDDDLDSERKSEDVGAIGFIHKSSIRLSDIEEIIDNAYKGEL